MPDCVRTIDEVRASIQDTLQALRELPSPRNLEALRGVEEWLDELLYAVQEELLEEAEDEGNEEEKK